MMISRPGTLTPPQVIEAMGIPWIMNPDAGVIIDDGSARASASVVRGAYCVSVTPDYEEWDWDNDRRRAENDAWIDAIHEATHLVLGAPSFESEDVLMAYEQAVTQELLPSHFRRWRRAWSGYALGGSDIGDSDDYISSEDWNKCVCLAKLSGILDPRGRPVWGLGVSSDFTITDSVIASSHEKFHGGGALHEFLRDELCRTGA